MGREKIGIDIDDVLARSAEGFAEYSNRKWGGRHRAENYTENWAEFWGISPELASERAEEFHAEGIVSQYRHFESAIPVLKRLYIDRDLVAITSRRLTIKADTDAWIERYFSGLFKEVCYAGIWDSNAHIDHKIKQTKAEVCREHGVNYLIDDQIKHCLSVAEVDIHALLFGNYRWNNTKKLPQDVTRVKDWPAVLQYFYE